MAFDKSMVMFSVIFMAFCRGVSMAAVYQVGDSAGWTSMGQADYPGMGCQQEFSRRRYSRFQLQQPVPQREASYTTGFRVMQCFVPDRYLHQRLRCSHD
ncbi:hypothetical protein OIU79_011366 [Salix purpurea]|uniref:Uncharacterized protein n=1 Tax=Salix purpurea TaxID=77065 RepID=A0A9Q0Q0I6_SALPP|nr:hypothetical protein OIU79_011366 [Salix purpurea]